MARNSLDLAAVMAQVAKLRQDDKPDEARERELESVFAYWGDSAWAAYRMGAAYHALTEPPGWRDVDRGDVVKFALDFVGRKGRWPTIDEQRRQFNRGPTRRLAGEVEEQERLEV